METQVKANKLLKRFMRTVAQGLVAGVFAGAEILRAVGFCRPFQWRKFSSFVTAIAERLLFGLATGAPKVTFTGFDCDGHWFFGGNNG